MMVYITIILSVITLYFVKQTGTSYGEIRHKEIREFSKNSNILCILISINNKLLQNMISKSYQLYILFVVY